jgi:hypothetical protein
MSTPKLASTSETATMASASSVTRRPSPVPMPSSTSRLIRSGLATTIAASSTVISRNVAMVARWGTANRPIRRRVWRLSLALTALRSVRSQRPPMGCMPLIFRGPR